MFLISFFMLISANEMPTPSQPCITVEHSKPVYDESNQLKGCQIEKVEPGSLHDKLGIKVGDIIHAKKQLKMSQWLKSQPQKSQ